jgi:small-conductance mechanosensitive channel
LYFSLYNDNFDEYTNQKEQINLEIKKVFEKLKIDMAFPTQEVIIKNVK